MIKKFKFIITALLCLIYTDMRSQEFKVASFRLLETDLTARVHPVTDLNGEACALIKVQMDKGFTFSGPLGIVKRIDQVAEIWLYVPAGTKRLTISHPQWGMIRDYELPTELKGKTTYEMQLEAIRQKVAPPIVVTLAPIQPESNQQKGAQDKWINGRWMVMANVGIDDVLTTGATVGFLTSSIGMYCSYASNWKSVTSDLQCDNSGALNNGQGTPYYQKDTKTSTYTALFGVLVKTSKHFIVMGGAGYGEKSIYWKTIDQVNVKNKDKSHHGAAIEIGMMGRWKHLALAATIETIGFKTVGPTIRVGYVF